MRLIIIDRWFEDRRTAVACLTMSCLIGALMLGGEPIISQLRYDRHAINAGEWWRLLTGHLVHASWPHTGLNFLGLVLIALLFPEPMRPTEWVARVVSISLGISFLIYWRVPELDWYVGLSGTLHGLFVLGFWWLFRQGDRFSLLLLAILLAKLAWEHIYGPISSNEDLVGVPVLVEAHSYGAFCALIYIAVMQAVQTLKQQINKT